MAKKNVSGGERMKIINNVNQKNMVIAMKKEANKKFTACNPEKCPRCRISDG